MKVNILQKGEKNCSERKGTEETRLLLHTLLFCEQALSNKTTILRKTASCVFTTQGANAARGPPSSATQDHSSVRAPPCGTGMQTLSRLLLLHRTHSRRTLTCAETRGMCLQPHRRQEQLTPTGVQPWDGFLQVSGLLKQGQASPGPRMLSSAPADSYLGAANQALGNTHVWCFRSLS